MDPGEGRRVDGRLVGRRRLRGRRRRRGRSRRRRARRGDHVHARVPDDVLHEDAVEARAVRLVPRRPRHVHGERLDERARRGRRVAREDRQPVGDGVEAPRGAAHGPGRRGLAAVPVRERRPDGVAGRRRVVRRQKRLDVHERAPVDDVGAAHDDAPRARVDGFERDERQAQRRRPVRRPRREAADLPPAAARRPHLGRDGPLAAVRVLVEEEEEPDVAVAVEALERARLHDGLVQHADRARRRREQRLPRRALHVAVARAHDADLPQGQRRGGDEAPQPPRLAVPSPGAEAGGAGERRQRSGAPLAHGRMRGGAVQVRSSRAHPVARRSLRSVAALVGALSRASQRWLVRSVARRGSSPMRDLSESPSNLLDRSQHVALQHAVQTGESESNCGKKGYSPRWLGP